MPALGAHVSEEEIWRIVAFVRSQHRGDSALGNRSQVV